MLRWCMIPAARISANRDRFRPLVSPRSCRGTSAGGQGEGGGRKNRRIGAGGVGGRRGREGGREWEDETERRGMKRRALRVGRSRCAPRAMPAGGPVTMLQLHAGCHRLRAARSSSLASSNRAERGFRPSAGPQSKPGPPLPSEEQSAIPPRLRQVPHLDKASSVCPQSEPRPRIAPTFPWPNKILRLPPVGTQAATTARSPR